METTWQAYKSYENTWVRKGYMEELLDIILLYTTMQKWPRYTEKYFLRLFQGKRAIGQRRNKVL